MKRRLFALALALLLAISLPVSALAATWYLEDGDITIRATEDGQYVSQGDNAAVEDNTPVIKQNEQNDSSTATDKTITIDAEKDATANVTLGGVDIDASSRGNNTAGIRTTGDGNVTIELDGNNSVKSAADAAGLQKENGGNLTIKDGNTTAGRLEATGGRGGAGIGGGADIIMIPEDPDSANFDHVLSVIRANRARGKNHNIIVVAEGVIADGHIEGSQKLAQQIEEVTGIESRATVLGHVQRGGAPSALDVKHASMMGAYAVDLLCQGMTDRVVAYRGNEYVDFDIDEALQMKRPPSLDILETNLSISTY